jgi:N utilization substance protein B
MSRQAPKNKRSRESREAALLLLFEWSYGFAGLDEILEAAKEAGRDEPDSYALELSRTTVENVAAIDSLIDQYSQGWKRNRLSRAVVTVLRMALCEMTLLTGVPVGVSINEAVELLKKYGTKDDAAYLNGVLGAFEQVRQGLKPEPPKHETPVADEPAEPVAGTEPPVELIEGFDIEIE